MRGENLPAVSQNFDPGVDAASALARSLAELDRDFALGEGMAANSTSHQ